MQNSLTQLDRTYAPFNRLAGIALALTLMASWTQSAQAHSHQSTATAHYLANEGVLVERGDTKVLFDALFSNGYDNYSLVPEASVTAMMTATPPYDGIDALFISHAHGDHFSPEPTLAYLRANPNVQLFAPSEAVDALLALTPANDSLANRLTAFSLAPGDPARTISLKDLNITIDVVAIPHAGGKRMAGVRNLVFRVTLDDELTVMHMGDAAPLNSAFAAQQSHWDQRTTHHAFPPYWFFEAPAGRRILHKRLRPVNATGVHVPAAATGNGNEWRERLGGDLFTDPGEQRTLTINPTAPATMSNPAIPTN